MSFIFFIVAVFILGSLSAIFAKDEKYIRIFSIFFASLGAALVWLHVLPVLLGLTSAWHDSLCLIDGFSALMATLVAFVYLMATIIASRYIGHEHKEGVLTLKDMRLYFALAHIFALCMVLTVTANNTLLLWIALEGTTLASTFLVGLYRRKSSVEAAWKYIIICSTGISLGLVGILLLSYGAHLGGVSGADMFMLTSLGKNAALIPGEIVRLAFVFLFVGFGAKVGFAPMHTWLPDAHGNAPSPVSAMFSGILLNVALYAIVRFKFIADSALGQSDWTSHLFLFFGALSIVVPAFMMLAQNNYKRMLAYSSVEHMGIISFAISLSPLGMVASLIHMVGHTLTKSLLFFGAGEILLKYKSTKTEKVRSLSKYMPYTATLFLLGILAIIALPPSALFVSEFAIFTSAFAIHPVIALVIFASLSIIAFSMLRSTLSMFSNAAEGDKLPAKKEAWNVTHAIMTIQLIALVSFGLWVSSKQGFDFMGAIAKGETYVNAK